MWLRCSVTVTAIDPALPLNSQVVATLLLGVGLGEGLTEAAVGFERPQNGA